MQVTLHYPAWHLRRQFNGATGVVASVDANTGLARVALTDGGQIDVSTKACKLQVPQCMMFGGLPNVAIWLRTDENGGSLPVGIIIQDGLPVGEVVVTSQLTVRWHGTGTAMEYRSLRQATEAVLLHRHQSVARLERMREG